MIGYVYDSGGTFLGGRNEVVVRPCRQSLAEVTGSVRARAPGGTRQNIYDQYRQRADVVRAREKL